MKALFTLLFFTFCIAISAGQTVLKYTLQEGDVFVVSQKANQVITQELDGVTHELTNTIEGILEFKVLAEKEESYEIALTFKDLNMTMTSSIQGELLNVRAKEVSEDDMQSKIFNSLLNSPVQMILAKNGDILEVNGGDSLVVKMANASGLEDEFSRNMMKRSLEEEFGSEALSNSYEQMTYFYAIEEVKEGDTWQNEYFGKLNTKNTWTLTQLNDSTATISGMAEVLMTIDDANTTMSLTGIQETQILTDRVSGFITTMKVEGESKGVSTMKQMSDHEIPTAIKSIITYQLIKE
ncbi:hypothetical protein MNBD_BACTEROID03-140 [hydrothermal vent metagenome]|uniref:Uncharacterized protein n=1 Tax=hydrothermal vent metagenome TaxID=652676 RepID=A0A3B0TR23_9ZZZZ